MLFELVPGYLSDLINHSNQNLNWKKLLGFRNMQEKFKIFILLITNEIIKKEKKNSDLVNFWICNLMACTGHYIYIIHRCMMYICSRVQFGRFCRYPKENNIKVLKITFYSDPTIGPHRAHGINAYKATVLHIHLLQILKIK